MFQKLDVKGILDADGGRCRAAFEHELENARADCEDRPGLTAARKVTLTITLKPDKNPDAQSLESVDWCYDVKPTIPKRSSKLYNAVAKRGGLYFNDMSPDDPNQSTIDDVEGVETDAS